MTIIGIDPGTKTGIAVIKDGIYTDIKTMSIFEAIFYINDISVNEQIEVYIENPNLRKYFGNSGREVLQGAGSIKRDYAIWVEFFNKMKIKFYPVSPLSVGSQFDNLTIFKAATGWEKITSTHARDAAKIIFKFYKTSNKLR
jgi:hypothetical protein